MSNAEQATGKSNEHYNLVSVLYHALQGGETSSKYISDAERAGHDDCAKFFREVQEEDRRRAERAVQLLDSHFH